MELIDVAHGYRLVEAMKASHPHAYAVERSYTEVDVFAVGESGVVHQTKGLGFAWCGRRLLPYDFHRVRSMDIDDGRESTIFELPEASEIESLVGSPHGREACLVTRNDHGYEVCLLELDGTCRSTVADVADFPLLSVCWAKRRAVLFWPGLPPEAIVFDIDSLTFGETQTLEQALAANQCNDHACPLHFPAPPSRGESDAMKAGGMVHLHRPTSRVALIVNDAELRVGEYSEPVHCELVARTPGPQYSSQERGYEHYADLAWSPTGRFLAATLAQWVVGEDWTKGAPVHLMVDLESKEVVAGPGSRAVAFAPK